MKQTALGSVLFFGVALLSVIVALLPLFRGGRVNAVFLSVAVVFFVLGIANPSSTEHTLWMLNRILNASDVDTSLRLQ